MADPITDLLADIKARINTITVVKNKIATVYEMDDFLIGDEQLSYPAVGIIYQGTIAKEDNRNSDRTGLAAEAIFDIVVLGGNKAEDTTAALRNFTTQTLDSIRNELRCHKNTVEGARRPWQFVREIPLIESDVSDIHVAYSQRWKTTIILT